MLGYDLFFFSCLGSKHIQNFQIPLNKYLPSSDSSFDWNKKGSHEAYCKYPKLVKLKFSLAIFLFNWSASSALCKISCWCFFLDLLAVTTALCKKSQKNINTLNRDTLTKNPTYNFLLINRYFLDFCLRFRHPWGINWLGCLNTNWRWWKNKLDAWRRNLFLKPQFKIELEGLAKLKNNLKQIVSVCFEPWPNMVSKLPQSIEL